MAHSLADFALDLAKIGATVDLVMHEAMEKACEVVETESKRVIGTYDYGWPQLAQATQEDRVRHGFPANEPLLRTGDLRESIGHAVQRELAGVVGYVGSNDPVAKFQELGTTRIPPRPFLTGAAMHKEREVVDLLGQVSRASLFARLMRP